MRILFLLNCVALFAGGLLAAQTGTTTQKKAAKQTARRRSTSATRHSSTPTSTHRASTTAARHTGTATASSRSHRASTRKTRTVAVHRPTVQQQPTPDRYREIQEALASRGYFSGTPDGTWGADSVDALKRFQRDQNLPDDGKIGSLSLIALGLGPKRATPVEASQENKVQQ